MAYTCAIVRLFGRTCENSLLHIHKLFPAYFREPPEKLKKTTYRLYKNKLILSHLVL